MKGPRFYCFLVVAALAAWTWMALHPKPERLIRRQLEGVARTASFGSNESGLAKLSAAQSLANFFATNVEVNLDVPGHPEHSLVGRDEIQQAALAARASVRALTVTFPDITVIVNADQESATVDLTLQAQIAGEQDMIVQEMKANLQKINGDWLITRVETVRTLR